MDSNTTRSEEVIEGFKKQKVASSAWHKIHLLIKSFDDDHKSDRRWARIGLITLILLLCGLLIHFFGTTEIKIS
jgi:hypothetical protein